MREPLNSLMIKINILNIQMVRLAEMHGRSHEKVLKKSQELDQCVIRAFKNL